MLEISQKAKQASIKMSALNLETRNKALLKIADELLNNKTVIFEANNIDLKLAENLVSNGEISQATFNRLKLDENKFRDMVKGVKDVAQLPDPINKILLKRELDNNLLLEKISCPIGVIGVIFEARPDVISQISALAIKSGNAIILKGGKEAINTNKAIFETILNVLNNIDNFPKNAVNQIFSREDVAKMLELDKYIDLIIPRGGNSLVKYIKENTKIPVLGHADGICHIFIDESADKLTTENVCIDAKTQYPSACNSVETILIHKNYPYTKELIKILQDNNILIKGDDYCKNISPLVELAADTDWQTEYGEKIVSLKMTESIEEAIEHINIFGSHHTDAIITQTDISKEKFTRLVDSAGVYINASTRFADGFRYGFGAEVGISTNKTHARGPVGLDGLTIYKYKLIGDGHIVNDYSNGNKTFKHKDLL